MLNGTLTSWEFLAQTLKIGGNSLGEEGGRALLRCMNYSLTTSRRIFVKDCAFITDRTAFFDPAYPQGNYSLNMLNPYER